MRKVIFVLAICLGFSISLSSCKDKKHIHSEETHVHDDAEDVVKEEKSTSNTLYQCPMDCEKGKSYIKEGSCPVCKMNLKPKEVDMDSDTEQNDSNPSEGERITKDAKVESTPNN